MTIAELRKAIEQFNDDDVVVVEIHEGVRNEDLYDFNIDKIEGLQMTDGTMVNEIRFCI